jgi:hypothetical protein
MERRGPLDIGRLYGTGRQEMKKIPIYYLLWRFGIFSFESDY